MFKLAIAEECLKLLNGRGGNGGLAEIQQPREPQGPPSVADNGGNQPARRRAAAIPPSSATPSGLDSPGVTRLSASPQFPPQPGNENKRPGQVVDLRLYLAQLCQQLPMPSEHLLAHYFTADDLADIKAGRYPDPSALGELIKTDPRYPFSEPGSD
jgi:hypothetical protein